MYKLYIHINIDILLDLTVSACLYSFNDVSRCLSASPNGVGCGGCFIPLCPVLRDLFVSLFGSGCYMNRWCEIKFDYERCILAVY